MYVTANMFFSFVLCYTIASKILSFMCNNLINLYAVTKDGHYFLSILEKETTRLLVLAEQAEKELEQPDLIEEAKGYLRSASGKAKLLVSQKMQQFRGLCTNNIKQVCWKVYIEEKTV